MIKNIGKVTLYVSDIEEAKKFWIDKLGFFLKLEKEMGPNMKWIEVSPVESEFTTFVLYNKELMKSQGGDTCHPSVILSTDNIGNAHDKMKQNGVEVEDIINMPYGKMFSFKDQDSNKYLLREDK